MFLVALPQDGCLVSQWLHMLMDKKNEHLRISGINLSVIPWIQTVKVEGSQENKA